MIQVAKMLAAAEEFSANTGFWAEVGFAAAISTALATAASTITAVWWRYQDRAEAEFSVRWLTRGSRGDDGDRIIAPELAMELQNIGDGAAHQVRFSGRHLAKEPYVTSAEWNGLGYGPAYAPLPVMRIGDAIRVVATAESFNVWAKAALVVEWWPPPTRKKRDWFVKSRKRTQAFVMNEISPPPANPTDEKWI